MKKFLLLVTLALSSVGFSQVWTEQTPGYPVSGSYTGDVSIVDASIVWSMVQRTTATNHQTYARTINGGTSWTTGTINVGNTTGLGIGNISAVSATTAWVSAFPTTAGLATQGVYKTTDGGATWIRQAGAAFTANSFINFVHFFNATEGVCMGDKLGNYFEIYTTTDGGTSWTRTPQLNIAATTTNYGYTGKFYVKGNTIWFGTDGGELMKSINKGLNWTKITTPVLDFGGGTVTTEASEFAFRDDNNGIIVKENFNTATTPPTYLSKNVYRTTNGGGVWTEYTPGTGMYHGSVDYAGTSMMVSAGSSTGDFGSSYSLDNGTTWTNIDGLSHTFLKYASATIGYGGGFATGGVGGIFKFTNNLGISSFSENDLVIYPNPVQDVVKISTNNASINAITLSDVNGRTIKTSNFNNFNEVELSVSELNSGIYFLNINTEKGFVVKKLIKE